jgi:hypothetical protein
MYRKLERYAALDGTEAPTADPAEQASDAPPAAVDGAPADPGADGVSRAATPS